MALRYKCLILDHDDTTVDSTSSIHYPAYLEIMRQLRPDVEPVSLHGWLRKNYHPGILQYYMEELGFSIAEIEEEYAIWRGFTQTKMPHFYEGFWELLEEFKARGGIITVVSHSDVDIIKKHYRHCGNGTGLEPEIIFGWGMDEEKRKPSPYPVQQILGALELAPSDVLVLDDLKPGVDMARASGVTVAAAGWGHQIPEIREDMEASCHYYFATVEAFREFFLSENLS